MDLKSLFVTFFFFFFFPSLPQGPFFQPGLSISYLRVLFLNGLYSIWIAKTCTHTVWEVFSAGHVRWDCHVREAETERERERDRSVTKAHIFIVLPHKTSKLCKHSFIVPKSYSALAYHQSTTNRIHLLDFDMLNVGCWKDWRDRQGGKCWQKQHFLLGNSISSPDCPSI